MRTLINFIYGVSKNHLPFDPNFDKQFAFTLDDQDGIKELLSIILLSIAG
jgi:hypothetical protein